MSGDHPTPSFGDPNAQPPTPKQTPTSAGFPTSVFETPKNNRASFEGPPSGWTPRFAEEYSVFNSTPGNLRGSNGPFVDFSVSTPYQSSNHHKRPLSAENIAAEIATHVTHFSPNPNLPLPPVDPTRRLSSSPGSLVTGQSPTEPGFQAGSQQLSKKFCRDTAQGAKTQTATPPPSTHKGQRRLAPKLQTGTMQNEGFEQEFVAGTPQQQHMPNFMSTTPTDLFGYPMSAPATAPSFGDSNMFWDADMNGMDIDFATSGHVFQTPSHRPMNSIDWGKSNELFQETGAAPPPPPQQQSQENNAPARKERVLAPKPPPQNLDTSAADTSMFASSFPASADESFNMNQSGGVDPGLLFTRPPSSGMEPAPLDPMSQPPLMQSFSQPEPITLVAKPTKRGGVRRTGSTKEAGKKINRATASSPIKPSDRPGLSRSFSEKINRKPAGRANLPNLAPATRPVSQSSGRSVSQGSRPNGRISPLKSHNHRLPSLSSIPETQTPRPRTQTSVKFTIDSKGRARAETTTIVVDDDDDQIPTVRRRKEHRGKERSWASSENDDDSSTDDEPIIIPSRNTSFALPQPQKPSSYAFHSSQRSVSDQSTSSLGIYYNELEPAVDDPESEAETVMNMAGGSNGGDAASELRKLVESRQKRIPNESFAPRLAYGSASSTITPSPLKNGNHRTPSSDRGNRIRCVCNTASNHVNGNNYMVQW
ncbi:3-isopropylmalate dehydrogenase [Hypoxylon texense]